MKASSFMLVYAYIHKWHSAVRLSVNEIILWNYGGTRSCNFPVLNNEDNVSCSNKQREPLMMFELTDYEWDALHSAPHCFWWYFCNWVMCNR